MEWKLSESEQYIMQFFWRHGPMKSDELAEKVAEKGWKTTTLLTFLSRLAAKGMLQVQKQGRANLYAPLVTQEAYRSQLSQEFLDEMYAGSAKNFLAALLDSRGLSASDVEELRTWLEGQEVEEP